MSLSISFDAVLFDCDGVLVDSEPITNRVLRDMLEELGWVMTLQECMGIFVGKAVKDEAAQIRERTGFDITPEWLAGFRARRNNALERELLAVPGAVSAARELHALLGGRIACASGADLPKVKLQLAKVGLAPYFQNHVFSGHDLPRSKPFPDVYLAAARALGVQPEKCAVVEDTVTGARAGLAAGATVFGYSPGGLSHSSASALREAGVHEIFADMAQLPRVLTRTAPAPEFGGRAPQ